MLRTVLRHAGGVRVDHVLGLFRLWWVPEGRPAVGRAPTSATTTRRSSASSRSRRSGPGAVVVGEDLGTVEPWVRDYLARARASSARRSCGSSRTGTRATPLPPETLARAVPGDGDHPRPAADRRLPARRAHPDPGRARAADPAGRGGAAHRRGRTASRGSTCWSRAAGWPRAHEHDEQAVVVALHRALAATPSRLLGVALTDAVGDRRAMNQPGTDTEYPNWQLPLADGDRHARPARGPRRLAPGGRALATAVRGRRRRLVPFAA